MSNDLYVFSDSDMRIIKAVLNDKLGLLYTNARYEKNKMMLESCNKEIISLEQLSLKLDNNKVLDLLTELGKIK